MKCGEEQLLSSSVLGYLESFMALVMAYSLRPSWRSISLKVPMQPANKCQYNVITLEVRCVANLPAEFTDSLGMHSQTGKL